MRRLIREWRPDVVHFHNIVPLISASAYYACHAERVPVVQTLHNHRLLCAAGTLLRGGEVCELCIGKVPWRAVRYGCYRGSRAQSLALAGAVSGHSLIGTWRTRIDGYIALTEFSRRTFIRGGLPADRIFVRPNAVAPLAPRTYEGPRSAVFVGRLSPEKGVAMLLDTWARLPDIPLTLVGSGPLLPQVERRLATPELRHVTSVGEVTHDRALELIARAGMLVVPSICYETMPYVALEALAAGVPVIVSDIGAQAEVVFDGVNGLHFRSGDAASLAAAARRLRDSDGLAAALAQGARRAFSERYSPERSYAGLMRVYEAVGARAGRAERRPFVLGH